MTLSSTDTLDARSLLRAQEPKEALERLKREVRASPRDPRLRTFLFQLFCVFGEWDRALTQLRVVSEFDPLAIPMVQAYRAAIRAEMLREKVMAGGRTPTVFGKPEQWMSLLLEALRLRGAGSPAEAARLRDAAFEDAPATSGRVDGRGFEWIADADMRFGPMLEAFVEGKYLWAPFSQIRRIDIEAPADLRDLVWMPAHFTWITGGETVGMIPTRYPGSTTEDALAMARRTEWREEDGWSIGLGQRMFATDSEEIALMDLRRIDLDLPAAPDADAAPPAAP